MLWFDLARFSQSLGSQLIDANEKLNEFDHMLLLSFNVSLSLLFECSLPFMYPLLFVVWSLPCGGGGNAMLRLLIGTKRCGDGLAADKRRLEGGAGDIGGDGGGWLYLAFRTALLGFRGCKGLRGLVVLDLGRCPDEPSSEPWLKDP